MLLIYIPRYFTGSAAMGRLELFINSYIKTHQNNTVSSLPYFIFNKNNGENVNKKKALTIADRKHMVTFLCITEELSCVGLYITYWSRDQFVPACKMMEECYS